MAFHFRHIGILLVSLNAYFSLFGASIINILRPSIFALDSTDATSCVSSARRSSTSRPRSLCVIARPRKRTEALTLSPLLKNLRGFFCFLLNSWSQIRGGNRTSLALMTFYFLRAYLSFFWCS